MIHFVSVATNTKARFRGSRFFDRPRCHDAISGFDPANFCRFLGKVAGKPGWQFACCPTAVDARFEVWGPVVAEAAGADSVGGTGFSRWPDARIPLALEAA